MQFEHATWLIAGLGACTILGFAFVHFHRKGQIALQKFASGRLLGQLIQNVSNSRRQVKRGLFLMAVAALFVALARPQVGFEWKEVKRKGIDILMAVDTSKSMLATDVKPNRLERSKLGIMDFVSKLEGDRVGLIPFAGTAFLMCPLTLDYNAFRQSLEALDTRIIPQGGTDLSSAIREARFAFSNDANHKILVLVTDGEDLEGEALSAAKEAAAKGLTIYTVGVGTPAGELIPLQKKGKGVVFAKDENGQVVKSRLDERMLQDIAQATGGQYEPLGQQAEGLEAIYQEKLSLVPKQELAERKLKVPLDRFEWPLLAAFILLLLEFWISDRKLPRKRMPVIETAQRRVSKRRGGARVAASLTVASFLFLSLKTVEASPLNAEKAYLQGDYSQAEAQYKAEAEKSPESPQIQFNLGAASYKSGKYEAALKAFRAALNVQEVALQNKAYYNMGNALYRQGQLTKASNPGETIQNWQKSIEAYEGALKLDSRDEDAVFNRDFVKKRLDELKKQQKKNQQKQEKDKNQSASQDNDKKNQNGSEGAQQAKKREQAQQSSGQQPESENKFARNEQNGNASAKQDEREPLDSNGKAPTSANSERRHSSGEMTREQAKNLLDSLKGEDQAVPMVADNKDAGKGAREKDRRDW